MSEVRGKCEFCVHWPPTGGCLLPDYACIDHEQDSPQWTPTSAAQIALRLEADLAAARAELERRKPEERVGECFCEPPSSRLRWLQHGRSFICVEPCWINEDTDDTYPPGCFCPDCGAELGDGTARRNADTALLDALERLALESAEHGEAVEIDARAMQRLGVIGLSAWPNGTVIGEEWVGPDLRSAIRAALEDTREDSDV